MEMVQHMADNVEDDTMIEDDLSDNVPEEEMNDEEVGVNNMEFTAKLTFSNVNNSSHGVVSCILY